MVDMWHLPWFGGWLFWSHSVYRLWARDQPIPSWQITSWKGCWERYGCLVPNAEYSARWSRHLDGWMHKGWNITCSCGVFPAYCELYLHVSERVSLQANKPTTNLSLGELISSSNWEMIRGRKTNKIIWDQNSCRKSFKVSEQSCRQRESPSRNNNRESRFTLSLWCLACREANSQADQPTFHDPRPARPVGRII